MAKHARFSASNMERVVECLGSTALIESVMTGRPPERQSDAARIGSAAHALAAHCLRGSIESSHEFEGWWVDDKEVLREPNYMGDHTWTRVDADMCWGVDIYLETCRRVRAELGPQVEELVEHTFDLTWVHPDCGGTGDYAAAEPFGLAVSADYKNGYGTVEVEDNYQLRTYAAGLLHDFPDAERARVTVVQPNARHKDGQVRSVEYSRAEIDAFVERVRAAIERVETDPDAPRTAGKWCKWCRAADDCPEARAKAFEVAGADFPDEPHELTVPSDTELERLAHSRKWIPYLDNWARAVEARVQELSDHGIKVPGTKLVRGRNGSRRWLVDDEALTVKAIIDAARAAGVKVKKADLLTEPKLKSPAQVEKVSAPVKKAVKAALDDGGRSTLWYSPEGEVTIADEDDPRPEVQPSVLTDFDEEDPLA